MSSGASLLKGIAFVLAAGIGWTKLPREPGYGSGWTGWMREWQQAGVFDRLHRAGAQPVRGSGRLDWSRAALDSVSIRGRPRTTVNRVQWWSKWWSKMPAQASPDAAADSTGRP